MKNAKKSTLSIIVPVYNIEKSIKKCIDSIRKQTYENLEVILVDDGSTDNSGEICDEYAKIDERIHVIHKNNEGPLMVRFVGIEKARGEYITFVDSDDWIDKEMYNDLLKELEGTHAEIVVSGLYRYWNESNIDEDIPRLAEGLYGRKDIEEKIIPIMLWDIRRGGYGIDPSLCSKIYRKELIKGHIENAKDLGIHYGEDISILYPMLLEANVIAVVHRSYYYHVQRNEGNLASYVKDSLFFEKLFILFSYLKKIFEKNIYAPTLIKQLEYNYMFLIQLRRSRYVQVKEISSFDFPVEDIPMGSNIVLYGAGQVGRAYYEQNDRKHFCNIILWVDKKHQILDKNRVVYAPEEIKKYTYDYILIGVQIPELAGEIRSELIQMGIETKKIIWSLTKIYKFLY